MFQKHSFYGLPSGSPLFFFFDWNNGTRKKEGKKASTKIVSVNTFQKCDLWFCKNIYAHKCKKKKKDAIVRRGLCCSKVLAFKIHYVL